MNVIQPLIELQDTDAQIRDLEREARDIPQRKAQELIYEAEGNLINLSDEEIISAFEEISSDSSRATITTYTDSNPSTTSIGTS